MARKHSHRTPLPDDIEALSAGLRCVSVGSGVVAAAVVGLLVITLVIHLGGVPSSVTEAAGRQAALATLEGWVPYPAQAPATWLLAAWILAGAVGLAGLVLIVGKWMLLEGVDDAPTRRQVTTSYLLGLLGWTCAFVAPYLSVLHLRPPLSYAPPLIANLGRLSLVFSALLFIGFVARVAFVLNHEELQERAESISMWLRVLVFGCMVGALIDVAQFLPLGQDLRARVAPIASYASIAVRVLTMLLAVILWIRQASAAARARKALRLSAEALAAPPPESFV